MSNNISRQLEMLSKGDITLFKLTGKQSSFNKELIWMLDRKEPQKGVTTDYFQYLLFLRGFKASTPLND